LGPRSQEQIRAKFSLQVCAQALLLQSTLKIDHQRSLNFWDLGLQVKVALSFDLVEGWSNFKHGRATWTTSQGDQDANLVGLALNLNPTDANHEIVLSQSA